KIKSKKCYYEYNVLKLYYYGLEVNMTERLEVDPGRYKNNVQYMIIPQSISAIASQLAISETQIRMIKSSAESCIVGMLAMLTMQTGQQLDIFDKIKFS